MKQLFYILAINPGSTSTKIAVFENHNLILKQNIYHNDQEISRFEHIWDQYTYRKKEILEFMYEKKFSLEKLSAVVGRGGLLRPVVSGTYLINREMLADAREAVQGEHASNLGCVLAFGIGWDYNIPSYVVDLPSTDEMEMMARLSGHSKIKRRSLLHALNIKAMARVAAGELKKRLDETNLIVAHIGGGVSITPLRKGRMIDTSNALSGGPFSAERSGSLPMIDFIEYIYKNGLSEKEAKRLVVGQGGMYSYLGTKSMIEAGELYIKNDTKAQLVIKAMAYQISKEIGAMAATLKGEVDSIIITGGMANSPLLVDLIREHVEFIAPIILLPGEDEMTALAQGALRVLEGDEEALAYPTSVAIEELF